jgi:prepilin-type N-terminal cleavage/methylation domain-containing protein
MFSRSQTNPRTSGQGFTLLEVMIAVMITSMLMFAIFRFVKACLQAINVSTEATVAQQEVVGFISYLQFQLEEIPARQQGALLGTPHNYNDKPSDEMEWLCTAGPGVLTTAAEDQYRVVLALQNSKDKKGELEIGLRRRPIDADEKTYSWVPLLKPAAALEIRYFEPRQKAWIDAWKDPALRPSLVRIRVWRAADQKPSEAILALPAARSQGL